MDKSEHAKGKQGSQMRFTEDELTLLRNTFKDNEPLVKLLRKLFLPEIDPQAPIGQLVDLWMVKDYEQMRPEDAKVAILSRTDVIRHVESCLFQVIALCETGELSPLQLQQKRSKDSNK